MNEKIPTREEALELLKTYNKTESLRKHALAVEGVMRYFARKRNEDEEKWGIIGLIHDLDYEQYPDQHCKKNGRNITPKQLARRIHKGGDQPRLGHLYRCQTGN
jgi:predicted hydrolase (HD superfamily)